MVRYIAWGALAIGVLVAGYFFFFAKTNIRNYPPPNATIVAFGDSLVQGVGATSGNDFVSVVSHTLGEPIVNMGISGNTTADGVARLDTVVQQKAGTVLVLLGGNDYLQRIPKAQTMANLKTIIERLQADGSLVVLLGTRGGLLQDNYEADYRTLAEETHAAYVPNVLDGIIGNRSLMYDQVHPNDLGYKIIAEKVARVLIPLRK